MSFITKTTRTFHDDADAPEISDILDIQADFSLLILEPVGNPNSFTLVVEGRALEGWYDLLVFNLNTLEANTEITSGGIWEVSLVGILEVRTQITAVDGELSVIGKVVG